MKTQGLTILFALIFSVADAQWSVLKNDPRIAANKNIPHLLDIFTQEEWDASNFASPKDLKWFTEARFGMFIHFGLNSYVNEDMSWPIVYNRKYPDHGHGKYPDSAWQITWPSKFKLEKFNADEWVQIAKDAGMKYIIIIAKHHDGFHMFDTKHSEFKITNTPFKRDYLKELVDACHKAKMPVGVYYSQRDWYHPDYAPVDTTTINRQAKKPPFHNAKPGMKIAEGSTHKKYKEYQFNVVRELCTKYGKLDIFWFDAVTWSGMFNKTMWDAEKLTRMIRELQPGILINNRASLPGDFDTPEQRGGMHQKRAWESCITLNNSWGYDPSPMKTVKKLIHEILNAAAGNGNVLLSWGAHFDGEYDPAQKDSLLKIGKWFKAFGNAYYTTKGGPWTPTENYGAVYKGEKIYIYVFNWHGKDLVLPALADNKIKKANFFNIGDHLIMKEDGDKIHITKPSNPDSIVTIIELTMKKKVQETFN